jgi:hypothetical protein
MSLFWLHKQKESKKDRNPQLSVHGYMLDLTTSSANNPNLLKWVKRVSKIAD